jgi:hypothetical protein
VSIPKGPLRSPRFESWAWPSWQRLGWQRLGSSRQWSLLELHGIRVETYVHLDSARALPQEGVYPAQQCRALTARSGHGQAAALVQQWNERLEQALRCGRVEASGTDHVP